MPGWCSLTHGFGELSRCIIVIDSTPPPIAASTPSCGDHVRGLDDSLQTRIAEPIDRDARRGDRQAGPQRRDACDVVALGAVRLTAAQHDFFDLGWIQLRGFGEDVLDGVPGEIVGAREVERSAARLGQRRTTAGNDDGFAHAPDHSSQGSRAVVQRFHAFKP